MMSFSILMTHQLLMKRQHEDCFAPGLRTRTLCISVCSNGCCNRVVGSALQRRSQRKQPLFIHFAVICHGNCL